MMTSEKAELITYDLGTHTLIIREDQTITIENDTLVVQLDREETYRLLVVLQEVFK